VGSTNIYNGNGVRRRCSVVVAASMDGIEFFVGGIDEDCSDDVGGGGAR